VYRYSTKSKRAGQPRDFCLKITTDQAELEGALALTRLPANPAFPQFALLRSEEAPDAEVILLAQPLYDGSLDALVEDPKHPHVFSDSELANIGLQLCHAALALKRAGLAHTDIKLENVFYWACQEGDVAPVRLCLGDLGSIKSMRPTKRKGQHARVMTFWPPEVGTVTQACATAMSADLWARTVAWAIGVTLLCCRDGMDSFLGISFDAFFLGGGTAEALRRTLLAHATKVAGGNPTLKLIVSTFLGAPNAPASASLELAIALLQAEEERLDSAPQLRRNPARGGRLMR
jgi:serine/threonine protein kinase